MASCFTVHGTEFRGPCPLKGTGFRVTWGAWAAGPPALPSSAQGPWHSRTWRRAPEGAESRRASCPHAWDPCAWGSARPVVSWATDWDFPRGASPPGPGGWMESSTPMYQWGGSSTGAWGGRSWQVRGRRWAGALCVAGGGRGSWPAPEPAAGPVWLSWCPHGFLRCPPGARGCAHSEMKWGCVSTGSPSVTPLHGHAWGQSEAWRGKPGTGL